MNHDCEHCDGFWMLTESGMKRCPHCVRGRDLRITDKLRTNPPAVKIEPVLSKAAAEVAAAAMGGISFFPSDPAVRAVIAGEIRALCATPADAAWLASKMNRLYRSWPGLMELRIVYYSHKLPHDRVLPIGTSEAYPDGIPPDKPEEPATLALPPGGPVSADPQLEAAVVNLARAKGIQAGFKGIAAPQTDRKPVTQADIDAAMEANRSRRAAKEFTPEDAA